MSEYKSIHYETYGDKKNPTVLFLHGFMGNGRSWNEMIAAMQKNYFCVTVDLPGHGLSLEVSEANFKMAECAKQIMAILKRLKTDKVSVVGYSMGARLGLLLALYYPEYLKKVILESGSPGLNTEEERSARQKSDGLLALELERAPLAEFVNRWYEQPLFKPLKKNKKRFQELLRNRLVNVPNGLAGSLRLMGQGAQPPLWEKLKELKLPTLLIVGELDAKFQEVARQMSHESKKIKIKSIADAGHNVHFEKPLEYSKALKNFLK